MSDTTTVQVEGIQMHTFVHPILAEYDDEPVRLFGIEIPEWIEDEDISIYTVDAIRQSGCASGAYMPAVTYTDAKRLMYAYGDAILDFIRDVWDSEELLLPGQSYGQFCCFCVSLAVELWAARIPEDYIWEKSPR